MNRTASMTVPVSSRPVRSASTARPSHHRGERGEGVISTAIAVLVMASLGALMWVGFQELWINASTQTAEQISEIGR